jgi:hypothetical protein
MKNFRKMQHKRTLGPRKKKKTKEKEKGHPNMRTGYIILVCLFYFLNYEDGTRLNSPSLAIANK